MDDCRALKLKQEDNVTGASFRDLVVWQRAIQLTIAIYKLTSSFPSAERFGLTGQLRRAAVSVASNIAEGYGKSTRGNLLQIAILRWVNLFRIYLTA
jgi:hypothetical protein